ncbi:hypothetical protein BJY04DRAFT_190560 [Aspergillus karnatakaensis]|uniref:uncharacterized protein n=1 Tax=Aspergillus karnatakaensis TaxID=1810916 RepID=UPI003CCE4B75
MTDKQEPLRGSCMCGRNQYEIQIPDKATSYAQVYFDTGRDNRRSYGTPLTAWLRVPLSWYQSHTQSYFPDETHSTIRRIFSPHHAPHTQRVFCGFCGAPLTYWSEQPSEEADYMSVTVGSLYGDDQRVLEDLQLLPRWEEHESPGSTPEQTATPAPQASTSTLVLPSTKSIPDLARTYSYGTTGGLPWFEEMIEGSGLGRLIKMRSGLGANDDRSTTIEWEVSEWTGAGSEVNTPSAHVVGKRKLGEHTNVDEI